ncbi:LysR family transcriptional regulator [Massilia sp. CF038]|uniref:LysR family transcriptional regulator n=1 Tax=Massilia sp. CF038 TaxID=1881045 RepID=UPI00091918F7|nr:LysR family transcriptional regulator [Massilia sp. CF038]SHG71111.1 transcriptional regulator, LysR family [Massilia sp. CF038]
MASMNELDAVLAVARLRSFRAAAVALGMSTSALSHAVAALEGRLGVRLFNRTTRSVATTEAGETFIANITPALQTIRRAIDEAGSSGGAPSGTLRINTPAAAAARCMPLFTEFLRRYPEVKLDIVSEGKLIDIVAEGFDAGIRLAESLPQDMIAVQIESSLRYVVVGSPDFLALHGRPATPADLTAFPCIRVRMPSGAMYRWEFERHGEALLVDVPGKLTLDQPMLMREAARQGLGLCYLAEWHVADDLAQGKLVQVLDGWTPVVEGLCLYYPGRRHVAPALRALVELAKARFSTQQPGHAAASGRFAV